MRMARIGSSYASAYEFSKVLMDDSWSTTRPAVTQPISGADGAFDFFEDDGFPVASVVATKKFAITASTSEAIEDALDELRYNTIGYYPNKRKLWWLDRDETTKYWSWAKTTSLTTSDTYREKGRFLKNVTVQFYMAEGVWYSETQRTAGPYSAAGSFNIGFRGTHFAAIDATVDATAVKLEAITLSAVGFTVVSTKRITYDDTGGAGVAPGEQLAIDSAAFSATNDALGTPFDAYDKISLPSGQVSWLLWPSANGTTGLNGAFAISDVTQGGGGSFEVNFAWYDTYVF